MRLNARTEVTVRSAKGKVSAKLQCTVVKGYVSNLANRSGEYNVPLSVVFTGRENVANDLRVGAKVLSTTKVHDRVRTGTIGVVVSFDDGLLDVVYPQDLGYHVDAEQVKDDMIHVAPLAVWS